MKRSTLVLQLVGGIGFISGAAIVAACSSSGGSGFGDGGTNSTGPSTVPTGDGSTTFTTNSTGGFSLNTSGGSGTGTTSTSFGSGPCPYTSSDTTDHDGDGWSPAEGDCNDCNKFINPGAYDIPSNGIDEDCNGTPDDEPTGCDSSLSAVATTEGTDGAKAMDLCRNTTAAPPKAMQTWGVISADYVLPDGSSSTKATFSPGFGILGPTFGTSNNTQEGQHMLGLSSGTARLPTDPGFSDPMGGGYYGDDKGYTSGAPSGFPGTTPACPGIHFGQAHDGAALRLVVRVPTNALTMAFDSNFFSHEFPDFVCSAYNDTYVVIMTPAPSGEPTSAHNNIAFDSKGNVISVNAGFLTVCDPNTMAGTTTYACAEGKGKLAGTGFAADDSPDSKDHASTDWLTTTVSVGTLAGQQITLLFAVWDSSDGLLDSTVLIDNVHWTFATAPNTPVPVDAGAPMTIPK